MSILIKGLNTLNTDNRFQFLVNQDNKFCCREYINCVDKSGVLVENGYRDYPVEFLPEKHGRLIDAEDLRRKMYRETFETDNPMMKWDSGCWIRYKMFEKAEENAPTIIEAE